MTLNDLQGHSLAANAIRRTEMQQPVTYLGGGVLGDAPPAFA